jgi:hypothetical protein
MKSRRKLRTILVHPFALAHLRVAAKIRELDRQIEALDRKLSLDHARRRTG